jgi:hypothetical protein
MAVIMKGLLVGAITASGISLAVAGGVAAGVGACVGGVGAGVGAGVGGVGGVGESAVSEESAA